MQRADTDRSRGRGLVLMVVLPCLNEARTVERVIARVPKEIPGVERIDIVVIDDGSSDETGSLAARAGAEVVRHERNQGLGATFREAVELALARGVDILVNIDGDGQFDGSAIPVLVAPIVGEGADMVTASRFMPGQMAPAMPAVKRWGNRQVAHIVALLTGARFQDVSCGFRAFSSEALLRLNLFGNFTYTQEAFIELIFKRMKIVEIPVEVRGTREFGSSRMASNLPLYALRALQIMLRAFISFRPLVFFSTVSALFAAPGLGLLIFLANHYLQSGKFSPHIWSGFTGGSFMFLAASTFVTGLVADMLVRIRLNQENSLYFLKSEEWRRRKQDLRERPSGSSPS